MSVTLGVVMDPIDRITIKKDSSFAMLLAAQKRGWNLIYMEQGGLFLQEGEARASCYQLEVRENPEHWYTLAEEEVRSLSDMDVILMRKDPPFDVEYIYSTYLLELAEAAGVLVVNKPQSLRDANEKLYTAWFPQCCPAMLVTREAIRIKAFLVQHQDIILKPLDGMGGSSIFRVQQDDPNLNVIIETLTQNGREMIMVQRFIPEITAGDKRVLVIEGEPVPYALARIPAEGETRGNLAVGGRSEGVALSERDRWICQQVAPTLREKGLMFVGLDIIGDYLTEINVTSPTCIRELDELFDLDIAGDLMDTVQQRLVR